MKLVFNRNVGRTGSLVDAVGSGNGWESALSCEIHLSL